MRIKGRPKYVGAEEKRVPLPSKVRPVIREIVLALSGDFSTSHTVETLLSESPRVKKELKARGVKQLASDLASDTLIASSPKR